MTTYSSIGTNISIDRASKTCKQPANCNAFLRLLNPRGSCDCCTAVHTSSATLLEHNARTAVLQGSSTAVRDRAKENGRVDISCVLCCRQTTIIIFVCYAVQRMI